MISDVKYCFVMHTKDPIGGEGSVAEIACGYGEILANADTEGQPYRLHLFKDRTTIK